MAETTTALDELIIPSPTEVDTDAVNAEACAQLASTEDGVFLMTEDSTPDSNDDAFLDMESYHDYDTDVEDVQSFIRRLCCCSK